MAAASFLEAGPSFSVHYTRGPLDLYLEGGVAGMMYAMDRLGFDVGWGPMVGAGMRIGPIGVGTHVMWSPGELNGTGSNMYAGGATVSVGY